MQLAQYALVQGRLQDCKRAMEAGREELEGLADVSGAARCCAAPVWWHGAAGGTAWCRHKAWAACHYCCLRRLFEQLPPLPLPASPAPHLQVDPQVSASVYYVASLYHKQQKEYAQYYRCAGRPTSLSLASTGSGCVRLGKRAAVVCCGVPCELVTCTVACTFN